MEQKDSIVYRYLPMTLTVLVWGLMNVPTSFALREVSPVQLLLTRTAIATVLLAPLARTFEGRIFPERCDWFAAAMMGLTGAIGNNLFFFYAVKSTSLTNIAIIFATSPLITTILAAVLLGERLSLRRICGIALALGGVIFLLCNGDLALLKDLSLNRGDLLEFCAAICASLMTIFGRKIKKSTPISVTFFNMLTAATLSVVIFTALGEKMNLALTGTAILSIAYIGVLGSGFGYVLQQTSIGRIGASATSAFLNANPAVSLLSATLVMGESVSVVQLISAAVIFVGIFLNVGARKETR